MNESAHEHIKRAVKSLLGEQQIRLLLKIFCNDTSFMDGNIPITIFGNADVVPNRCYSLFHVDVCQDSIFKNHM